MTWGLFYHYPQWLMLIVNLLAVHRLSRFVARDELFNRPRNAITAKWEGALVTLLMCMWCLSVWFAALAVVLTAWDATRHVWLVIASVLAISSAAGLLSERG